MATCSPWRWLIAVITAGCVAKSAPLVHEVPYTVTLRQSGEGPHVRGLSGLARDKNRTLWAVPERTRELVAIAPEKPGLVTRIVPLDGVPEGADTEGLAILADGRFAFATERQEDDRSADLILFGKEEGGRVRIIESLPLSYDGFHLRAEGNRGIEGLCAVGDTLIAGVETVIKVGGERFAPIAIFDLTKRQWSYACLKLTSKDGRLA